MGVGRKEFKKMAQEKLQEAKLLLKHKHFEGSFYLAGYAVEFALKARICKVFKRDFDKLAGQLGKTAIKTHERTHY